MKIATLTFGGGFAAVSMLIALAPMQISAQAPKTKKETVRGTTTTKTEQLNGTVTFVTGNTLVVMMSNGEVRNFQVPPTRRFMIDGKELTVDQLQTGTTLTATTTTYTTPVAEITTTSGTGKILWVEGNSLALELPTKEVKTYTVPAPNSARFTVDGKQVTLQDLKKGMTISAARIVELPKLDFVSNIVVTGHAPK
jgi:hypothetical protein